GSRGCVRCAHSPLATSPRPCRGSRPSGQPQTDHVSVGTSPTTSPTDSRSSPLVATIGLNWCVGSAHPGAPPPPPRACRRRATRKTSLFLADYVRFCSGGECGTRVAFYLPSLTNPFHGGSS